MISSSRSKLLRSLQHKKYRDRHQLFVVEGEKMVGELTEQDPGHGFEVREIYATPEWIRDPSRQMLSSGIDVVEATREEIQKVSTLVSPQAVIALVSKPKIPPGIEELIHHTVLAFESIRDPGNLGTIVRTADWFGIKHIICSPDSTDIFNPKVIQATMGAFTRVKVYYSNLSEWLDSSGMEQKAVYGTYLEGENIYETSLHAAPVILFGNESRGLSDKLVSRAQRLISIPSFSEKGKGSESLNVASSVAVVCSEIKRRK